MPCHFTVSVTPPSFGLLTIEQFGIAATAPFTFQLPDDTTYLVPPVAIPPVWTHEPPAAVPSVAAPFTLAGLVGFGAPFGVVGIVSSSGLLKVKLPAAVHRSFV